MVFDSMASRSLRFVSTLLTAIDASISPGDITRRWVTGQIASHRIAALRRGGVALASRLLFLVPRVLSLASRLLSVASCLLPLVDCRQMQICRSCIEGPTKKPHFLFLTRLAAQFPLPDSRPHLCPGLEGAFAFSRRQAASCIHLRRGRVNVLPRHVLCSGLPISIPGTRSPRPSSASRATRGTSASGGSAASCSRRTGR